MKAATITKTPQVQKEPKQVSMKVIEIIFYTLIVAYWASIFITL